MYRSTYQTDYSSGQAPPPPVRTGGTYPQPNVHSPAPLSPSGVQLGLPPSPVATLYPVVPVAQGVALTPAQESYKSQQPSRASIIAAQQGLSDDQALAIALKADEDETQLKMLKQDEQLAWLYDRTTSACMNDQALAAALAEEERGAAAARAAAVTGTTANLDLGANHQSPPASLMYPEVLYDDSRDELMGSRLFCLPSITLRPRVNKLQKFFQDHITDDRSRLLKRLEEYSLVERTVQGDGACQFRSLSDQLYGSPDHHAVVRQLVVQQLKTHADLYKLYVPQQFDEYLMDMSKPSTWGDHITLKAASDYYGLRVVVLTSFVEKFVLAIEPAAKQSHRVLWLSFWAEVHYNSIYPVEDPPGPLDAPLTGTAKVLGSKKLANLLRAAKH